MLTTAGGLVFAGDARRQHRRARRGDRKAAVALAASATSRTRRMTYMLDGRQYLLVAAGDTLYAFVMY